MPNSDPGPVPVFLPPAGVQLKDASVNIADVDPILQSFLTRAGLVHLHLFNERLVVTSGKDGTHGQNSKHYTGRAVDVRIKDLRLDWQAAFLLYIRVLCDHFTLTVFDESNAPGGGHLHIEIAG
jgi:hypothetical protein